MSIKDRFLLDVENKARLNVELRRAIISVARTGSMEAMPSLQVTVDDPQGRILGSRNLLAPKTRALGTPEAATLRVIHVRLDGHWYQLTRAHPTGTQLALQFDHRGAVAMEAQTDPISATRGATTRALFVRRQVLEIVKAGERMAFWAFAPGKELPTVAPDTGNTSGRAEKDRPRADDLKQAARAGIGLRLRGNEVNEAQRKNMAIVMSEASALKAPPKAVLALVEACIIEAPDFNNPTGGDGTSAGILQLTSIHLGGSVALKGGRRDVALCARLFLTKGFTGRGGAIKLAGSMVGATPGEIAQAVQGSAVPGAYETVRRDAERVVEAFGGVAVHGGRAGGKGGSYVKAFHFKRPKGEGAWTNTGRLAEEIGYRRFVTFPSDGSDVFVWADDRQLLTLKPQATIDAQARYVTGRPEYDLDQAKTTQAVTMTVLGDAFEQDLAWGIPVRLRNAGPADGTWLVWEVQETDGRQEVELELRMPTPSKPEPAAEVVQRADSSDSFPDVGGDDEISKAYAMAQIIDKRNLPYGPGGHGQNWQQANKASNLDCSSSTSLVLHAGGMLDGFGPVVSDYFLSWGKAGPGKRMTVHVTPGSGDNGHVMIEFHLKGRTVRFDTSPWSCGPDGPHLRTCPRSFAGMTPRHWPGDN